MKSFEGVDVGNAKYKLQVLGDPTNILQSTPIGLAATGWTAVNRSDQSEI